MAMDPGAAPLIRIRNLSRHFAAGADVVRALDDVSLDIPGGEFLAVVGRSGSGKSTLLHLLAAMDVPTSGTIQVGAWDLSRITGTDRSRFRRTEVGMVFQQFNLIPSMDAIQNVELPLLLDGVPPAERRQRAVEGLEQVGLGHRQHHRPFELSGGEQQRVAIARALVHVPRLILADEPTGNLDSRTAGEILSLLAAIHGGDRKTLVLVTHNVTDARRVADRILYLDDGRFIDPAREIGSPEDPP